LSSVALHEHDELLQEHEIVLPSAQVASAVQVLVAPMSNMGSGDSCAHVELTPQ